MAKMMLKTWDQFWFTPRGTFMTSLFRCSIAFFIFIFYLSRFLEFEFFFGESGILSYEVARNVIPFFHEKIFPVYPSNETFLFSCHILFLSLLVLMILGVGGRTVAFLTLCFHIMFLHRNYLILYGIDFIAGILLFMCIFLKTNNYLTILNCFKKKKQMPLGEKDLKGDLLHSVGCRLLQLQILTIYIYSAMEKIRGTSWWKGDAIWTILTNEQLVKIDMGFLSYIPALVAMLTFFIVLYELYFPILVWIPKTKYWTLAFGVVFHLLIGFIMNIPYFSVLVVLSYLVFLDYDRDIRLWFEKRLKT